MAEVILFGEPMVMFMADTAGPLEEAEHFTRFLAGAEVNVAIGLSRLGHSVSYVTRLGDDTLGRYIKTKLSGEGIETHIAFDGRYMTGFQLKEKVQAGEPRVCCFRKNSAASRLSPADVEDVDFSGARLLHLTGIPPALSPGTRRASYRMLERAREAGLLVSFDPNLQPALWEDEKIMIAVINDLASRSDIVLPGYREGKLLTGNEEPEKIANFYIVRGAKMVTVKLGKRGSFTKNGVENFYQEPMPVDRIADRAGAGDGFAVGLTSGILEGLALCEAVGRGNAIGALQLRHPGDKDGLPTAEELKNYMEKVKSGAGYRHHGH
ncbi:MAG: sugar kinase [Treponema sp.]|jgi:2-dehydro-3-deoxygluconokinase|nr:sugar kinase [Treponema sp.]